MHSYNEISKLKRVLSFKTTAALLSVLLLLNLMACDSHPGSVSEETSSLSDISSEALESQTDDFYSYLGKIGGEPQEYYRSYPDKSSFLKKFDLADTDLIYTFTHTGQWGEEKISDLSKVELYFSEAAQNGVVFLYREVDGSEDLRGIAFDGVACISKNEESPFFSPLADPFDMTPFYTIEAEYVRQKQLEKRDDGKPLSFQAFGSFDSEADQQDPLYFYSFSYREDGTLALKKYGHDPVSSLNLSRTGYYDEMQRLVYEKGYITHGHLESYTVYAEDGKTPLYSFELDFDISDLVYVHEFVSYR